MTRSSIVIVGAGISGLAAAWELSGAHEGPSETSPRVEVLESAPDVGGSLATTTFAGRTLDLGADGFLARRDEATTLVREIGWQDRLEAIAARGASIWLQGALDELPSGLILGVPTSSSMLEGVRGLSRRARAYAKRDELLPARLHVGEDISIGEILRTKLGPELAYRFAEPMIGGIQAGRIDQLSAKSVFPALFEAAQKRGSLMKNLKALAPATGAAPSPLFYTLTSGVGSLCVEVARQLKARGVVVRTGVAATALRRSPSGSYPWEVDTPSTTTPANAIIVTTPASDTARLLGHFDPAFDALARVASASAAMVTFSVDVKHVTLPERGTGVLVPLMSEWSGEGSMMVTAITLLDRKWPHLAREGDVLLRAHVGRSDDVRFMALDDDELVARVAQELSVLLPRFASFDEALVQRWPHALPQYYVGHEEMVRAARTAAKGLQLALAGNAYDGVGVPASIGSGRAAAREILESVA